MSEVIFCLVQNNKDEFAVLSNGEGSIELINGSCQLETSFNEAARNIVATKTGLNVSSGIQLGMDVDNPRHHYLLCDYDPACNTADDVISLKVKWQSAKQILSSLTLPKNIVTYLERHQNKLEVA